MVGTGRRKWTKVQEIPAFNYALVLFHFFGLRNARETTVYGFVYLYDIAGHRIFVMSKLSLTSLKVLPSL